MEKELGSKIFMMGDYTNKEEMETSIKGYIAKMKKIYPNAVITKEFYKCENILVRVTKMSSMERRGLNENEIEKVDDWHIRQRGER